MKKLTILLASLALFALIPSAVFADEPLTSLRIKTNFNIWRVNLEKADWLRPYPKLSWNGFDVKLPDTLDGVAKEKALRSLNSAEAVGVDFTKVRDYLEKVAAPELNREPQDVTISLDDQGKVKFDGFAFNGQSVDYERAFYLIRKALQDNIEEVRIPLTVIPAKVNVLSDELKQKGITQLISTGETNFKNSPTNRRINIRVGLAAFNGKLVAPGVESGAGEIIGRVDGSTGYAKELVIKGDKTIPEFGGGLCQVSTTVYRSLLIGGFPITERTNHSYAVSYYDPQGLDATIYPPDPDMKFINDTPNYILLQTTTVGDKAYSNVYGTPVDRQVDLIGPWYYAFTGTPPPRTEYTTKLAPGEKQLLGAAHGGFKASWYRRITYADPAQKEKLEHIFSNYEARPLYTLIGVASATADTVGDSSSVFVAP
ncbi:VanW family protein [Candidatus Peregrinibacteria bacterium]|nr:VanW family protein [Candidatus Peregrinibacteria bacterium]